MIAFLIIVAVFAAIYLYAAVVQYYGFKNWHPMCGGKGAACYPKRPPDAGKAVPEAQRPERS